MAQDSGVGVRAGAQRREPWVVGRKPTSGGPKSVTAVWHRSCSADLSALSSTDLIESATCASAARMSIIIASCCSKACLVSRISSIMSSAFAWPWTRMHPLRNSSKSMYPSPLQSRSSKTHWASLVATSMTRKKSWTAGESRCLSISSRPIWPLLSRSRQLKSFRARVTRLFSFSQEDCSIAFCTNVPVIMFRTARVAKAIQRTVDRPQMGSRCSISGWTMSFQSTPPVRAWKSESDARVMEPYHIMSSCEPTSPGSCMWSMR
mmetsp:Transcript_83578/g.237143  ORF Transcript_83578/g.237143 Transcript_83578/m.237143 type:complete len:263 (+) Transcript_83578:36-824(+)